MLWLDGYIFILGLVLGSFYNVVGGRVAAGQSIIAPPSHCTSCGRRLTYRDLVPVFSWLFLRGRCRTCGARISPLYPVIEAATGVLFLLAFLRANSLGVLLSGWLLVSLLMIVTVSDMEAMLVPDKIVLVFLGLAGALRMFWPTTPWWDAPAGALAGFLLLLLIAVLSKGGMGGGDVKLFAVLGLLVGVKLVLIGFFFSTALGALIGGAGRLTGRIKKRQPVPFVPFIALGMLAAFFFGNSLFALYVSLFL
ncbi:MAG: prepilin peptidase [Sporolactobacillus sp.]